MAELSAILDADGTLLDSMPLWDSAGCRWLRSVGVHCSDTLAQELAEMSLEEASAYLREKFSLRQTAAQIKDGVLGVIREAYAHEIPAKPGAADFLAALRDDGIPAVIATSGNSELIAAALERLSLAPFVQRIFTCGNAGAGKHEPAVYLRAAEFLGTAPVHTFVFEDALYAVRTANRAGFVTVGVYDAASDADRGALEKECALWLRDLTDYAAFRRFAAHISGTEEGTA